MQLNNLKSAWEQLKLANTMQHFGSEEILLIIEGSENANKTKTLRVLFNIAMFIFITMICQGG